MTIIHIVLGIAVIVLSGAAALLGGLRWYRAETSERFWPLLRAAQAAVAIEAIDGGVLFAIGRSAPENLHLLYGLLPLAVALIAEQLRIGAAQTILEARGMSGSADVGRLPEAEQRSLVRTIMRRELGTMAASSGVVFLLALRAGATAGGWL